jgi:hypothetical protein
MSQRDAQHKREVVSSNKSGQNLKPVSFWEKILAWFRSSEEEESIKDSQESLLFSQLESNFTKENLLARIQEISLLLQSEKQDLLKVHGKKAEYFVARYVDRHFALLHVLQKAVSHQQRDLLKNIRGAPDLMRVLLGETSVGTSVQNVLEENVHQDITNDISILLSLASQVPSRSISDVSKNEHMKLCTTKVCETLKQLQALQQKKPFSQRLHHLFSWKESVDSDRQRLHDAAISTLEWLN